MAVKRQSYQRWNADVRVGPAEPLNCRDERDAPERVYLQGLNQRVKIVEKENETVSSTKQLVWIPGDTQRSEERDGSNNVTKRFYGQGVQIGSTNYYYTRDHLMGKWGS
jgi:hypothetical protein